MNAEQISRAIATNGASVVYAAAVARMDGNREPLKALGLDAATIGDANRIMRLAFDAMSAADKANDLAGATINAAKIKRHR